MTMDEHVLNVLKADNPWLTGRAVGPWLRRPLPSDYVARTLRLGLGERVQLVVGPRQAGKSTLVWHTLAERGRPVLFINCEEPSLRAWLRSPALFVNDLERFLPNVPQVFFEEAQHLDEAGLLLKGIHDRRPDLTVFVTGSSSFHLEAATRESLAGRADRHLLLPFSLAELALPNSGLLPVVRDSEAVHLADRMACMGGYPSVHRSPQPELELARLVEAFVLRDASDRFRIQHVGAFRKIMELAAGQVGQLCNLSEWAAIAGISRDTVRDYLQILEDTHIVRLIRPFVGGHRAEITGAPKPYFLDNGFRNRLAGGFAPLGPRPDRGQLLENLVFSELAKTINPLLDSVRFWRSKAGAEVDFIVEHAGRILPIEVKSTVAAPRMTRSMRSFIDAYKPPLFIVATPSGTGDISVSGTEVRVVPVHALGDSVRQFVD